MSLDLKSTIGILTRTPAILEAWLTDLDSTWTEIDEGHATWSASQIVAHLVHSEKTNFMTRVRSILDHGTSRSFPEFDPVEQFEVSRGKTMVELLADFRDARSENLADLAGLALGPVELNRRGLHPHFGEVTLEQQLSTWVVHDLGHLAQIARVMAKRYKNEVGPWIEYLPVLTDREAKS